jgi:hypothetical protein
VKLSDLTDREWFDRLNVRRIRDRARQTELWAYYDGEQALHYVARIIKEQQDRFPALRVNWPALVIDALEERLDIEGFRLGGSDSADDDLIGMWEANNLKAGSSEAHIAAMVTREAYLMVGPGEGAYPLVTIEYPDQVAVERDPRSGRVIAALKVWSSDPDKPGLLGDDQAVLYLPGRMVEFERGDPVNGRSTGDWTGRLTTHQTSPLVPVVPLINRPRRGVGRTELRDIMSLANGVNQTATNMMAGLEHHALPRKWVVGASEQDFVDPATGKPLPAWMIATGAIWALRGDEPEEDKNIRVGQFSAADMTNFHNSIKQLASLASALYGLPQHYMGFFADNPASAEGIKSSESRLIKRAERAQGYLEDAWESASRIGLTIMGRDPATADRMETIWRDPSTPTRAQQADAAVKLHAEGIIDTPLAQEMTNISIGQRRAMEQRRTGQVQNAASVVNRVRQLDVGSGAGVNADAALAGT